MGLKAKATAGADDYFTNISGNNYVPSVQGPTTRCKAYSFTMTVSSGAAGNCTLFIFDLAAGSGTSKGPVATLDVAKGTTGQLHFAEGAWFRNGIYVVVATGDATDANTAPTAAANNAAVVRVDFRTP